MSKFIYNTLCFNCSLDSFKVSSKSSIFPSNFAFSVFISLTLTQVKESTLIEMVKSISDSDRPMSH